MKILIINGPNLNFLGIRDKEVYGREDFASLLGMIRRHAGELGAEVDFFQSNSEGGLIDRIQAAYRDGTEGMVINPGAYSHYSYALRDALDSYHTFPKIEVHISDIMQREDFRHTSVTGEVCDHQIVGHGLNGYLEAMDMLAKWENKDGRI
ncbi:MAG: 3-dehydroquinate dehydratase [Lachnospiraceae bacterium]|nr:3-dehydroquinate dehydratase [Lachnospiraceae bacterium]